MTVPATDNVSLIRQIFLMQKEYSHVLRREEWQARKRKLQRLRTWILGNRARIHEAAYQDFRKPATEVDAIEIFHVLNEIQFASKNLREWTSPKKVDAPWTFLGTRSVIRYEPKGCCLVISPWNYPFALSVGPLVSAIAAGNTVILKPSEFTPHMSALIHSMVKDLFEPKEVAVIEGSVPVATELLALPFDHIFFTGSPSVGKIVMKAAAEHLTSVTLELGGKSPCIVAADADLNDAAERIVVAKFVNNGQTCIAPDYVIADEKIVSALTEKICSKVRERFSEKGSFATSPSYCRIVNDTHFHRLADLVADAKAKGTRIEMGGEMDERDRFIAPIVLSGVPKEARVLEEEIFGPILPVMTMKSIDDAIQFVNEKPKPLALYLFTNKRAVRETVLQSTSAGGVCINDCGIHFLHHGLPFGGVNTSGHGKSHGYHGFLAFSNEKPVLRQRRGMTSVKMLYPPYTSTSRRIMEWFLKLF